MSFFDYVSNKVEKVEKDFSKNKGEVHVNVGLPEDEVILNKYFCELGKVYFSQHKDDENLEYASLVEKIKEIESKIHSEISEEIKKPEDTVQCETVEDTQKLDNTLKHEAMEEAKEQDDTHSGKKACPICQTELSDDTKFCINCGHKIEQENEHRTLATTGTQNSSNNQDNIRKFCTTCGYKLTNDLSFCPNCGANVKRTVERNIIICDNCRRKNKLGKKFCSFCGRKLNY